MSLKKLEVLSDVVMQHWCRKNLIEGEQRRESSERCETNRRIKNPCISRRVVYATSL